VPVLPCPACGVLLTLPQAARPGERAHCPTPGCRLLELQPGPVLTPANLHDLTERELRALINRLPRPLEPDA
jgi:hypothetical protein